MSITYQQPALTFQVGYKEHAMHGRADVQKQDYFNVSKTFDNLPHQVWEHQWAYLGSAKGPAVVLGEPHKSTCSMAVGITHTRSPGVPAGVLITLALPRIVLSQKSFL